MKPWPRSLARGVLRGYQIFISPWLPDSCRFTPTCSVYGMQAIDKYGIIKGSWMATRRILRCHPFSRGGLDPVT